MELSIFSTSALVYADLYAVKANFLNAVEINKEVEALKLQFPEKSSFFDFLKKYPGTDSSVF